MKRLPKFITTFLMGVGIGNLIQMFLSIGFNQVIIGSQEFMAGNSLTFALLVSNLIYGGFGLVGALAEMVFENDLGLSTKTFIHLLISLIYFVIAGVVLKWFSYGTLIYALIIYLVIYFVIWVINYFIIRAEINEINKKLK